MEPYTIQSMLVLAGFGGLFMLLGCAASDSS